jgi:hypothetical protein
LPAEVISGSAMLHRRSGRRERHASSTPTRRTIYPFWLTHRQSEKIQGPLRADRAGDETRFWESKVSGPSTAAAGLHYDEKAETFLRDAIRLDPSAVEPGIQLARLRTGRARGGAGDQRHRRQPPISRIAPVKGDAVVPWRIQRGRASFDEALKIEPSYSWFISAAPT